MTRGLRARPLKEPEPDVIEATAYAYEGANEVLVANAEKHSRNTAGLKPWLPGQSGNPAGRPATSLKASLRKAVDFDELAVRIWADCQRTDSIGADMRVKVYEWFEGKAHQSLDVSRSEDDPAVLAAKQMADAWDRIAAGYGPTLIEAPVSQPKPENE